mmetsp:Transcript_81965/g.228458  ORF Transcript_81965/g.228458 Transcript_81965/m.228458 type:complete len:217 (-) Transcript_81965:68-718(-)
MPAPTWSSASDDAWSISSTRSSTQSPMKASLSKPWHALPSLSATTSRSPRLGAQLDSTFTRRSRERSIVESCACAATEAARAALQRFSASSSSRSTASTLAAKLGSTFFSSLPTPMPPWSKAKDMCASALTSVNSFASEARSTSCDTECRGRFATEASSMEASESSLQVCVFSWRLRGRAVCSSPPSSELLREKPEEDMLRAPRSTRSLEAPDAGG